MKTLKERAQAHLCTVKRVRRSRNWALSGRIEQLERLSRDLCAEDPTGYRFVIEKLQQVLEKNQALLEPLEAKLLRMIAQNRAITLSELMDQTGCSLAQARQARFAADEF